MENIYVVQCDDGAGKWIDDINPVLEGEYCSEKMLAAAMEKVKAAIAKAEGK